MRVDDCGRAGLVWSGASGALHSSGSRRNRFGLDLQDGSDVEVGDDVVLHPSLEAALATDAGLPVPDRVVRTPELPPVPARQQRPGATVGPSTAARAGNGR